MLARDGAAEPDARLENIGAEQLAAAHLGCIFGVKQYQRMQIAIARVEYIHTTQVVLHFHLLNCPQHLRQTLARNRGVHAHIVGADAAGSGKGILSAAPKFQALRLIAAHLDARGPGCVEHGLHAPDLFLNLLRRAVALAEQNGRGLEVVIRVHEGIHGGGHRLVHHLEARGNNAVRDDARDGGPRRPDIAETRHDAQGQEGVGNNFTGASVVTGNIPSLPMTIDSRSRPGASKACDPNSTPSPSPMKPRTRNTLCKVRPYFRQCTPPEFSATLPPMVQAIWLLGAGA